MEDQRYIKWFNSEIVRLFRDAVRISWRHPRRALYFIKTLSYQKAAAARRAKWEAQGVHVPAFGIFSVTGRCNLRCQGCYAQAQHRGDEPEMTNDKLRAVLNEAAELGIAILLLAGGEPLTREDLLEITRESGRTVFALFTNGLLIDDAVVQQLKRQPNVVPVISIEGHNAETDNRRGSGVYRKVSDAMAGLKRAGVFFGVSTTVTRTNFETVTSDNYIRELMALGAGLFFFVEYIPVREGTEGLVITQQQRDALRQRMNEFRASFGGLFIAFPGDEEESGGCLSAGRGFVHISPQGKVEPCPFAPYADADLNHMTLKAALQSPFLKAIRDNHARLTETSSGCALWEDRVWVRELLASQTAETGQGAEASK